MTRSVLLDVVGGYLLFAFLALLIIVSWGYMVPLGFLVLVLFSLPRMHALFSCLDGRDYIFCFALLCYAAIWMLDIWQCGGFPWLAGVSMSLWPVLAVVVLVWARQFPPPPDLWWSGLAVGAFLAGCIALFEHTVLMHDRAGNGMNAIPFGNIALLFGALTLVAFLWWSRSRRGSRTKASLALVASAGGIVASLLSGTRGGWVALPVLIPLIWMAWWSMRNHQARDWGRRDWLTGLLVLLMFVGILASGSPGDRLAVAVDQFHAYWVSGDRGGSIGLRLEMWKGGVMLFSERPLTGWGEGGLQSALDTLVSQGLLYPGVSVFTQLHSDMIDTAARRGLVGLVSLLGLYGVPLTLFWRCRRDPDPRVRLLAIAGVMIVTSFMIFGLSQSMLRDVRGLSGYLGLCVGCWAVLRCIESSHRSACPPGERCVNARAPVR